MRNDLETLKRTNDGGGGRRQDQAVFDVRPYLNPSDPWPLDEGLETVSRIYDEKHRLALLVRPRTVVEIGVRCGYSAAAFLSAGATSYVGLDLNCNLHGGYPGSIDYACRMLREKFPAARVEVHQLDSQACVRLPYLQADLFHVDGDHSYRGATHDLELARAAACQWLLVDDVDWDCEVGRAVHDFLRRYDFPHVHLPTVRGDMLIQVRGR